MIRPHRTIPSPRLLALGAGLLLSVGLIPAPARSVSAAQTATAGEDSGVPAVESSRSSGSISIAQATTAVSPRTPAFRHIYLIVFENHEFGSIVGSSSAPYLNALIRRYGLATNYHAIGHPSEPNYLALFSGSTQGVTNDAVHDLAGRNLVDQLHAHGRSFRVFAENVPLHCYKGATASGGEDGSGTYARKHEPAISFTDISHQAPRCANILDFRHFSPSAASFELIVPNMCHSMHDCSVARGDAWLHGFLPRILRSSAMAGSAVFVTWDEGSSSIAGGGKVATLVIGPGVKAGYRSSVSHTHYSLLRTIEDAWGLGCLNRTCVANDMREFFR